jgi:3-methylfumaryl-CoA hydratase
MSGIDFAGLRGWIGRSETAEDTVTPRLLREYAATMDVAAAQEAPLALHWCLAPAAVRASEIGADGHPAKGGFLPPVPLPRRMWAGGELQFRDRLRVGDAVTRRSEIADVAVKEGRTGILCFVAVKHEVFGPRGLAVSERQDLVYREAASAPVGMPGRDDLPVAQWRRTKRADPVLLFRYSALTFNGHRIHYDRDYAMGVEHYRGLVVHGPLQATWLLEFAAEIKGAAPAVFRFRGVSPLFDFENFELCARESESGLELWIATADGVRTMTASARW